jgi:hypothetical protein
MLQNRAKRAKKSANKNAFYIEYFRKFVTL